MKEYGYLITIAIIAIGVYAFVNLYPVTGRPPVEGGARACTMEAKLCPDGSAVGRSGPSCEFAECPSVTATTTTTTTTTGGGNGGGTITPYDSGVRGAVLLGPTCPVERIPPDPACADRGYATTVVARRTGSSAVFATAKSNATGAFTLTLPPGAYTLTAGEGKMLPRCSPTTVTVGPSGYTPATISCDTGIR